MAFGHGGMKHVVIDARMIQNSGIGRYLRQVMHGIQKDPRFRVTLLGSPSHLRPYVTSDGRIDMHPCEAPLYSFREQLQVPFQIPKCDLFFGPHYVIPLLYRGPMVVTIYDVIHLEHRAFGRGVLGQLYARSMMRFALKRAKAVLTISEYTKRRITELLRGPAEKIHVIYIGVDSVFFVGSDDVQSTAVRARYGLSNPYVLFVGNPKPHKNLATLIKAFARVLRQRPDYDLVVVGQLERIRTNLPELRKLIEEEHLAPAVRLLGDVPDVDLAVLYHMASLFVFPSLAEGFGLPPLEAMAAGVPVVASTMSAIPEACGDAAHYYSPAKSADALAAAISEVLTNASTRRTLIAAGRERAHLFTPADCARQTLNTLYDL